MTSLILAAAIGATLLQTAQGFALRRLEGKIDASLQAAVWDRLLSLPVPFFRGYTAGDLAARSLGIGAMRQILTGTVINAVIAGPFSAFSLGLLFHFSRDLAWLATALTAVMLLATIGTAYLQVRYQRATTTIAGRLSGTLLQIVNGASKLRVAAAEERAFAVWADTFGRQEGDRPARAHRFQRLRGVRLDGPGTQRGCHLLDDGAVARSGRRGRRPHHGRVPRLQRSLRAVPVVGARTRIVAGVDPRHRAPVRTGAADPRDAAGVTGGRQGSRRTRGRRRPGPRGLPLRSGRTPGVAGRVPAHPGGAPRRAGRPVGQRQVHDPSPVDGIRDAKRRHRPTRRTRTGLAGHHGRPAPDRCRAPDRSAAGGLHLPEHRRRREPDARRCVGGRGRGWPRSRHPGDADGHADAAVGRWRGTVGRPAAAHPDRAGHRETPAPAVAGRGDQRAGQRDPGDGPRWHWSGCRSRAS